MIASSLLSRNSYIENSLKTEAHLMLKKDHFRIWSPLFIDTLTLTLFYFSLKGIHVLAIFLELVQCFVFYILLTTESFYVKRKARNLNFPSVR
jgi:hypothetical protein